MKANIKKSLFHLLLLILLSIFARFLALITPNLSSDEGVVAIMSLRVMQGEFPVFFYGQRFMGSLEAYLTAVLFHCFQPSLFTLELLPAMLSILFLFLIYFLAKRLFGYKVAFVSGLLIAIPSSDLMHWSYEARSHYPLILFFGTLLFILIARIVYSDSSKNKTFLLYGLVGLVAGLGWWTNYLMMVYIIPAAFFLFLHRKKILFSKNLIFVSLLFLSGSLPLWIFNLINHHSISGISNWGTLSDIPIYLKGLFTGAFPILIGLRTPLIDPKGLGSGIPIIADKFYIWWVFFLGSIYSISLMAFFIKYREGIKSLVLKFNLKNTSGGELLLLLFAVNISIVLITKYGAQSSQDSRYLLPLFTCLPIFMASFLVDLEKKSRIIAVFFLTMILFFNICENIRHNRWIYFNSDHFKYYQDNKLKEGRLLTFLMKNGFNRIYVDKLDALGKKLILTSKEALIFSSPHQEVYLKYANQVDGSDRVSYLFQGENQLLEENLVALGGSFRKIKTPDGYVLYTDFKPPTGTYRPVSRCLWTGKSTPLSPDVKMAFDGDVGSGWSGPSDSDTSFTIDFGRMETINKVSIIPGSYQEIPTGYQIAISPDGRRWQMVTKVSQYWGPFFWSGPNPLIKIRHGRIEAVFPTVTGRFLRILSIGKLEGHNWSINEIFVYGPGQGRPQISYDKIETNNLLNFLKTQKIDFVYADHWLSAVIRTQSNWTIGTITSNHFLGDYGEKEPLPDFFPRVRFTARTAFILEYGDRKPFEDTLSELGCLYQTRKIGPFIIYFDFLFPHFFFLPSRDWKVSSNVNDKDAGRVMDHDLTTRWTSLKPQEPGIIFTVDLGKVRRVKGFVLWVGEAVLDYPRKLEVMASSNGVTWQKIETQWFSDFYWSGTQLLKIRGGKTCYLFSPTDLRYLKLQQEGTAENYWSIYELDVIEGSSTIHQHSPGWLKSDRTFELQGEVQKVPHP